LQEGSSSLFPPACDNIWWKCHWCDFSVHVTDGGLKRHASKRTRLRKQHLEQSHPDKNHRDPSAAVAAPSEDHKNFRMESIKASRIRNAEAFVTEYNGPHSLSRHGSFQVQCSRCR
jgi:hypothetical protein